MPARRYCGWRGPGTGFRTGNRRWKCWFCLHRRRKGRAEQAYGRIIEGDFRGGVSQPNLTFALRRVFAALPNYIWFACNSDTVEKAEKGLGEDLPSFLSARLLAFCCFHVSAQHRAKKGWQGSPLLQRGGESPAAWFQDRAADGVVPGRDQRPAA